MGMGITHDPSERLSYYLASAITEKRPNYAAAQAKMKQVCSQCHTPALIDRVYSQAEKVVENTNEPREDSAGYREWAYAKTAC